MADSFFDNFMFLTMMKELPRNEFLFRLRQDYEYIIKTIDSNPSDPSRLERLQRWKLMIRELYLTLTHGGEIEDFIQKN